jgi:hypothetical protein
MQRRIAQCRLHSADPTVACSRAALPPAAPAVHTACDPASLSLGLDQATGLALGCMCEQSNPDGAGGGPRQPAVETAAGRGPPRGGAGPAAALVRAHPPSHTKPGSRFTTKIGWQQWSDITSVSTDQAQSMEHCHSRFAHASGPCNCSICMSIIILKGGHRDCLMLVATAVMQPDLIVWSRPCLLRVKERVINSSTFRM